MKKRTIVILVVAWLIAMTAIGASALTLWMVSGNNAEAAHLVSDEQYQIIERYSRLDEVYQTLMGEYYKPLDGENLVTGAVRGMMGSVEDPYTFYYTPEEMKAQGEEAQGRYHGVGMAVQMTEDNTIRIIRVYENSPAERAGLHENDILLEVDGTPVSGENGKALEEAVQLIMGEDGTAVQLTVERGGERMSFEAERSVVSISYVDYCLIGTKIGYVNIAQFTGDAADGFDEAMSAFQKAGVSGMIVDLRNNPGGWLTEVVKIADRLLPEGLITYVEDREGNREEELSDAEYWDIPMVVLVNEMSASASELFTAAIQDYDRGTVVGVNTFGKGIVQNLITFAEDGAGMQFTVASYFSPKGREIHGVGVAPDVEVPLNEGVMISPINPDPLGDNQLAAALEELEKCLTP